MNCAFRPIVAWPRSKTANRRPSPFKASYSATLDLLENELRHLGARDVIIQTHMPERDIRNDGWPRSDARTPPEPGVIVTFQSRRGPISIPCDRFYRWQENLRAIALGLESLRRVDRYGISQTDEQYRGWKALPSDGLDFETAAEAADWMADHADATAAEVLADAELLAQAFRQAALKLHPDHGGNAADFQRLQNARKAIIEKRGVE